MLLDANAAIQYDTIIQFALSAYIIFLGIYMLATGKMLGSFRMDKYDETSVKKYCRIGGPLYLLAGVTLGLGDLANINIRVLPIEDYLVWMIAMAFLLVALILWPIILKKKGTGSVKENSESTSSEPDQFIDED